MRKKNDEWRRFISEHNIDRESASDIRDKIVSFIRTERCRNRKTENLEIDRCVKRSLEENGVADINGEDIRNLRKYFVDGAEEDGFRESLMSSMLYLMTLVPLIISMLGDLFPELYNDFVEGLISGLACILGKGLLIEFTFSKDESERLVLAMIYLLLFAVWFILYQFCRRREGVRHQIYYYNRHAASLTFIALFLFYIAGYVVCQFSDTVLSFAVIISLISAENLKRTELKTILNLLLWFIRFVIVCAAMIYPIYLARHYQNVDRRAETEMDDVDDEESQTYDDEYKTYVVRVRKRRS